MHSIGRVQLFDKERLDIRKSRLNLQSVSWGKRFVEVCQTKRHITTNHHGWYKIAFLYQVLVYSNRNSQNLSTITHQHNPWSQLEERRKCISDWGSRSYPCSTSSTSTCIRIYLWWWHAEHTWLMLITTGRTIFSSFEPNVNFVSLVPVYLPCVEADTKDIFRMPDGTRMFTSNCRQMSCIWMEFDSVDLTPCQIRMDTCQSCRRHRR